MATLVFVVVLFSCVVMFSRELGNLIKKIWATPAVKLLFPLIVLSFLIVSYESIVFQTLITLQKNLLALATLLASWIPLGRWANYLAKILILMGWAFIPTLAINTLHKRRRYQAFQYNYLLILILWLSVALLFTLVRY